MSRRRSGLDRRQRCVRAFTIVELLVVVAMLAILAAIIFPLLSRVRETARRAQCTANLRQLGEAFSLYANDWYGYWPSPGGLVGDRSYWSQSGPGGLYPYVRQRGLNSVWCCPLLSDWRGKYPARSYSMNSYLRTPADAEYPTCIGLLRGINICRIRETHRTILLFEGVPRSGKYVDAAYSEDQVFYIYRCANWTWVRGYYSKTRYTIEPGKPWHGRVNNYLYCDGHVTAREPYTYQGKQRASFDEEYEWYVDKAAVWRRFRMCGE